MTARRQDDATREADRAISSLRFQKGPACWRSFALSATVVAALSIVPAEFGRAHQSGVQAGQPGGSQGQIAAQPAQSARTVAETNQLEVGTAICAVLTKTVDANKAKAGDKVVARATLAVLSHGHVLIADGAKITGHVTKVTKRSDANPESEVSFVFDRVALKDGGEMRLPLTVQAIGYSGVNLKTQEDSVENPAFVPPLEPDAPSSMHIRRSSVPRPQSTTPTRPEAIDTPELEKMRPGTAPATVLDVGSKGVVGLPGLTLKEGQDARVGSVVTSSSKNVKLENGSQLVLRVIGDKEEGRS